MTYRRYGGYNQPQGGSFYNPYSKYPDFAQGIQQFVQNLMAFKEWRSQQEARKAQEGRAERELKLREKRASAKPDWQVQAEMIAKATREPVGAALARMRGYKKPQVIPSRLATPMEDYFKSALGGDWRSTVTPEQFSFHLPVAQDLFMRQVTGQPGKISPKVQRQTDFLNKAINRYDDRIKRERARLEKLQTLMASEKGKPGQDLLAQAAGITGGAPSTLNKQRQAQIDRLTSEINRLESTGLSILLNYQASVYGGQELGKKDMQEVALIHSKISDIAKKGLYWRPGKADESARVLVQEIISRGYINPQTQKPFTLEEALQHALRIQENFQEKQRQ